MALGARRGDRLESLAGELGDGAHAFEVDVSDEAAARSFIESSAEAMGGIDVLINNAGVMLLGPVGGADTDEWRRMIEVNLLGLLYCTHAALPLLGESERGHVVNVSSVAGRLAGAGSAVYNMTKWGVTGFSEGLRQEALHAGVRVTCLEPGFVETELHGHNENPVVVEAIDKEMDKIGEVLTADDMAQAILFALSQPQRVRHQRDPRAAHGPAALRRLARQTYVITYAAVMATAVAERSESRRPRGAADPRPARVDGPQPARPRRSQRRQRADALPGRARGDQPDAGGGGEDRIRPRADALPAAAARRGPARRHHP